MVLSLTIEDVLYPDCDGKPISDNTLQYKWIVRLKSNIDYLLKDQVAFVAGDLLWYPVQVKEPPAPCQAPDVLVSFGRPKGERGSYKQWKEDNIPPQVVVEILSPSNTANEMLLKQEFYGTHGVLEMYFYDPDSYDFWGLVRDTRGQDFTTVAPLNFPWQSPLLGLRFEMFDDGLAVFYPDGRPFEDPVDVLTDLTQAETELNRTQLTLKQVQEEREQVQEERDRAFAKLQDMGIDPDAL